MSGRRPAWRPARQRPARRSKKQDDQLALLGAGVLVLGLVITVVHWLLVHWWVLLIAAVVVAVAGYLWGCSRHGNGPSGSVCVPALCGCGSRSWTLWTTARSSSSYGT